MFRFFFRLCVCASLLLVSTTAASAQSITTDKSDYAPGETVIITGTGWMAGEQVIMVVHEAPPLNADVTLSSVASASGSFTNKGFVVPSNADLSTYTVDATGVSSGLTAEATFADAIAGKGSLCADVAGAGAAICPTATGAVGVTGDPGSPFNQRYKQILGSTAHYVIIGATDAVVDATGPCAGQVQMHLENPIAGQVNFCSSSFDGSTITFTAPAASCQITLVDYKVGVRPTGIDEFRSANNDIVADGIDNGTPNGAAGIQYVYPTGEVVSCATTTTEILDASNNVIVSFVPGVTIVHDKATVTGTPSHGVPTGSVTFTFFTNDPTHTCVGPSVNAGTLTLDAMGVANPSKSFGPLAAGSYSFRAKFHPAAGPYNDHGLAFSYSACEALSMASGTSVTTDIKDASNNSIGSATIGSVVHDTATVTVASPATIPAASTVTFNLYGTIDCSGTATPQTVSIASGVSSATVSSGTVTLTAAGAISFRALFNSGDVASVPNGISACEPLVVNKAPTSVTTQVHNPSHMDITGQTVPVGTTIHDSATVSGQVGSIALTGTVTYQFFTNGTCSGTASTSETVAVGLESTPQTPSAGAYSYLGSYSGDANYTGSTGTCEPITIATAACGPGITGSLTSGFNGTAIPAGDYVWFNSNASITHVVDGSTVSFTGGLITVNGTPQAVADSVITFSASVTKSTVSFNTVANRWEISVPLAGSDEIFVSGLPLVLPSGLHGGASVTWSGNFSTNTSGLSLSWKWGAAVYTTFTTDLNAIGVKPTHTNAALYNNSDHAGTPENFKASVIGGARGGGGSNWTGSWSGTQSLSLCQ